MLGGIPLLGLSNEARMSRSNLSDQTRAGPGDQPGGAAPGGAGDADRRAAIRLDTPGPIFFSQERVGFNGKTFKVYKFRSMVLNAEAMHET